MSYGYMGNTHQDELNALIEKYMHYVFYKGCYMNMKDMSDYLNDNKNRYIEYSESMCHGSNTLWTNFITEYATMVNRYNLTWRLFKCLKASIISVTMEKYIDRQREWDKTEKYDKKGMEDYIKLLKDTAESITVGDPRKVFHANQERHI